jgi:hypothetical protein
MIRTWCRSTCAPGQTAVPSESSDSRLPLISENFLLQVKVDDKNVVQEYVCPGPNCGAK